MPNQPSATAGTSDPVIALWSVNYAQPVAGPQAWLDLVAAQMREAASARASLLVLPEYVSAHWLHWADGPLEGRVLMNWMADQGASLLPGLEALVRATGIGLVAGSMPHAAGDGRTFNRSWVLLPDDAGGVNRLHHDKLVPTPPERPEGDWPIACGGSATLFEWRGLKLAILICLDVEMPAIVAKLEGEVIDLLIVPSMTALLSGYHRVFDCAKASAVELFTSVAVVGGIGGLPWGMGGNCGGAAVFVPCEAALGSTGRLASIGPLAETEGAGPLLTIQVPIAAIRSLRKAGPEAWPGPFPASGLSVARW